MMDSRLLGLYFLLGGATVALVTYFGSHERGLIAAFVANLPTITIITLCTTYLSSGAGAAVSYFRGILILLPAWLLYAVAVIFLLPHFGLVPALLTGVSLYLATALLTMRLVH